MANIPGYYHPVWFYPGGIANILSLWASIMSHMTVAMATAQTNSFLLWLASFPPSALVGGGWAISPSAMM
jgi:hypothetical protein